jgi:hypothetical protein
MSVAHTVIEDLNAFGRIGMEISGGSRVRKDCQLCEGLCQSEKRARSLLCPGTNERPSFAIFRLAGSARFG